MDKTGSSRNTNAYANEKNTIEQNTKKIRYAVMGLGWITQVAMLPAFRHAKENSELVALISDDEEKLQALGRKYKVKNLYNYENVETCFNSGLIDALVIGLPNHLHCKYTKLAAAAGIHVLCEKPMATSIDECKEMMEAVHMNSVKLMIAYRLHFEGASLDTLEKIRKGVIGEARVFNATFATPVKDKDNIRLQANCGGGVLYDIGIYCINAARHLFESEPTEVFAVSAAKPTDERFTEVEESACVSLKFPGGKLANFACSFGTVDFSSFDILGTHGKIRLEPAFEFKDALIQHLCKDGRVHKTKFAKRDQFAPEIIYFSRCIIENKEPEPSGEEGLADLKVIDACYESIRSRQIVTLPRADLKNQPTIDQDIRKPPVGRIRLVHASSPAAS